MIAVPASRLVMIFLTVGCSSRSDEFDDLPGTTPTWKQFRWITPEGVSPGAVPDMNGTSVSSGSASSPLTQWHLS